jgi:hypothetical protein
MMDTETARSIAQQLQQHSFEPGPLNDVKEPACSPVSVTSLDHLSQTSFFKEKKEGWEITT